MGTVVVINGKEAREKLCKGVDILVDAVGSTLGANGLNAFLIDNLNPPRVTKDGVTVAKSIRLYDYIENAGADIIKQASMASAEEAGDGSSTSCVIAGAILKEGLQVEDTVKKHDLRIGMTQAVKDIVKVLDKQSVDVSKDLNLLKKIGTTSANNNEEIGNLVAETVYKFGSKANIILSREDKGKTLVEEVFGYTYMKGISSHHLSQIDGDCYVKLDNPKLLVIDDNINDMKKVVKVIQECINRKEKLVIMANYIGDVFLSTILTNIMSGNLSRDMITLVPTPNENERKTDSLKDIVRCSGAKMVSFDPAMGLNIEEVSYEHLGTLKLFEGREDRSTLIFDEKGEQEVERIRADLEKSLEGVSDNIIKDRLQERIRRLSKGAATIYVSAKTEAEHSEKYDLYEDSLRACQSALEEGVLDGGGLALLRASEQIKPKNLKNKDEEVGYEIVRKACQKPFETIILNSGVDLELIKSEVIKSKFKKGYDAKLNKIVNMKKAGIVDPKKVTRIALQSALSASVTILTTGSVIVPYDFDKK